MFKKKNNYFKKIKIVLNRKKLTFLELTSIKNAPMINSINKKDLFMNRLRLIFIYI